MARKVLIYVVVGIIAVNLSIFLWVVFSPTAPNVPLPNPNGYDDFLKAVPLVSSSFLATYIDTTLTLDKLAARHDELAGQINTNSEALALIKLGLSRECREPVEYSTNYTSRLMSQLNGFRQLAYLLAAKGRLAEVEGRTNDATDAYVDGIRFAEAISRGGLVITKFVGIACEDLALRRLSNLLDGNLSPTKSREIAGVLETLDGQEDSPADLFKRDRLWGKKTLGLRGRISALLNYKSLQKNEATVTANLQAAQLRRRTTMLQFAQKAYRDEKVTTEKSVADLVPGYLKAVPKDPVTGKDLTLGK